MKVSKEQRIEILASSFEVLKSDVISNGNKLKELIGKVAKLDSDLAVEMWIYLLRNYPQAVKGDAAYVLTDGMVYEIENKIGKKATYKIISDYEIIRDALFSISGDVDSSSMGYIQSALLENKLGQVDELLTKINENRHKEQSLFDVLESLIPEDEDDARRLSEDGFNLLNNWIKRVKSKEQRAKLNVQMMSVIEAFDEDEDDEEYDE